MTCFMMAALGSDEGLREELRESIVVAMGNRSFRRYSTMDLRFVVLRSKLLQQRKVDGRDADYWLDW